MLRIVICDEDRNAALRSRDVIGKTAERLGIEAEINIYYGTGGLLLAVESETEKPDILFTEIVFANGRSETDIVMKGLSVDPAESFVNEGMTAAARISQLLPRCGIVFLTAHTELAGDAYAVPHLYLLDKDRLEERMEGVFRAYFRSRGSMKLAVTAGGKTAVTYEDDILCIERNRRSCMVVTQNRRIRTTELFEEVIKRLRSPHMLRCHNSYLVNLNHVILIRPESLELKNGRSIPVSRNYRKRVREALQIWLERWL